MRSIVAGLSLLLPVLASAQLPSRAEILVVGTYHMNNPGHDIHSTQVDDVLAPKRQQEITQLIEVLKRFHPTKIAIEAGVGSQRVKQQYADYLADKYTLTRNEIDQIGFRLARELGATTIYPVDEDGDFPFMRVRNYAIANGVKEKFEAVQAQIGARVEAENRFLASHTVLEAFQLFNSDSVTEKAVGEYYTAFVPFGEPYDYAGPDLLAAWFQRNIRIHHNVVALVSSPSDRILVLNGSGHLGWMRQNVSNDPTVTLRKLSDFDGSR